MMMLKPLIPQPRQGFRLYHDAWVMPGFRAQGLFKILGYNCPYDFEVRFRYTLYHTLNKEESETILVTN